MFDDEEFRAFVAAMPIAKQQSPPPSRPPSSESDEPVPVALGGDEEYEAL